jgi:hypothetical protein
MRLYVWMDRASLRLVLAVAVTLPFWGAGCVKRDDTTAPEPQYGVPGGMPPTSAEPAKKSEDDESFTTLDEAERALSTAQGELASLFAPAEPATQTAPPPPPPAPGGGSAPPRPEKLEAEQKPASRCELACKAFSSLGRAADAVCRLAGAQDARCARARASVDDNRRRVASCGCG